MITDKTFFRVVRGSLRNVSNAHPNWGLDDRAVQSIAKRLAGTLRGLGVGLASVEVREVHTVCCQDSVNKRRSFTTKGSTKPQKLWPKQLLRFLGSETRLARGEGNIEREKALVDVLRFMSSKGVWRNR